MHRHKFLRHAAAVLAAAALLVAVVLVVALIGRIADFRLRHEQERAARKASELRLEQQEVHALLAQQILHQQTHGATGGALGSTALPGSTGDIQMRPGNIANEFLQKFRCRHRTCGSTGHIAHISKVALEAVGVFVV